MGVVAPQAVGVHDHLKILVLGPRLLVIAIPSLIIKNTSLVLHQRFREFSNLAYYTILAFTFQMHDR